jgi:phytanoyl-CoA hydroxylase
MNENIAEERRRAFRDEGYVIVRDAIEPQLLATSREVAAGLIAWASRNGPDRLSDHYLPHRPDQGALYDVYQRHPHFVALARHPKVIEAIRQVYADSFFLYENSLLFKPRGSENEVPWHQDFMSRPHEPFKIIAWMALDDVDVDNGAVRVVPGTHRRGYLSFRRKRGETHHTRADLDGIDLSRAVDAEMRAGDVLLFHCALLHGSRRIDSPRPRRAYRAAYQNLDLAWTPRGTPLVVSLATPEDLSRGAEPESRVRRLIHRVGARLLRV